MALSHIRLTYSPPPASQLHRPRLLGLSGASACLPMTFWLQASSQFQLTLWLTPLSQSRCQLFAYQTESIPSTLFKHDLAWCSPSCFHNKLLRAHTCLHGQQSAPCYTSLPSHLLTLNTLPPASIQPGQELTSSRKLPVSNTYQKPFQTTDSTAQLHNLASKCTCVIFLNLISSVFSSSKKYLFTQ